MTTLSPLTWAESFSGAPILHGEGPPGRSGLVRRWRGTDAVMVQPPLDHHYVVMHLGGAKRVRRLGEGPAVEADVAEDALTFVPAGAAFTWRTDGPIDFAHLYIHPSEFERVLWAAGAGARRLVLPPHVGVTDGLLSGLFKEMLAEATREPERETLYVETLFNAAVGVMAHRYLQGRRKVRALGGPLPPVRLRRVLDHVEDHLAEGLSLAQLSAVVGLSPFHFSRVFRDALGETPAAYVERRRVEVAARLLAEGAMSVADVAHRTGFRSQSHFARRFRLLTGLRPSDVRPDRPRRGEVG